MKDHGVAPFVFLVVHRPLHVAHSLQRRSRLSIREAMTLWLSYMLEAEAQSREALRCFFIFKADEDSNIHMTQISQRFLKFDIPHLGDHFTEKAKYFLDGTLCSPPADEEGSKRGLHDWINRVWIASQRLAVDSNDQSAIEAFDQVREVYQIACDAFVDPL